MQSFTDYMAESMANSLVKLVGRKLKIATTTGKPDKKSAPKWASALGQTPEGAWHWLEKKGPVEDGNSDTYFPQSGKTMFSGFHSKGSVKGSVESI